MYGDEGIHVDYVQSVFQTYRRVLIYFCRVIGSGPNYNLLDACMETLAGSDFVDAVLSSIPSLLVHVVLDDGLVGRCPLLF